MTSVTLIRHGQANTGAQDEASYDRLSDLGHQQARWLGEYQRHGMPFEEIWSGSLNRQRDTAAGVNTADVPYRVDPRLNELDFFGLAACLEQRRGLALPQSAAEFASHLPEVLNDWKNGEMNDGLESFEAFRTRIFGVLREACTQERRIALVTSTGVISTLAALALSLDTTAKTQVFLRVSHTSLHRFEIIGDDLHLLQFGATPHLDTPERASSITFV